MDRVELERLARDVRDLQVAIAAADTPENEQRLIALGSTMGVTIKRLRRKSAARYRVTVKGSSIEPATLHDIDKLLTKFAAGKG